MHLAKDGLTQYFQQGLGKELLPYDPYPAGWPRNAFSNEILDIHGLRFVVLTIVGPPAS